MLVVVMLSYHFIDSCDHVLILWHVWYVVFKVRHPGINNSWRIFQDQLNGFSNNNYGGYANLLKAQKEYPIFLDD
jgi:hypothetical protein